MKSGYGALVGVLAVGGLLAACGSDGNNSNDAVGNGEVEYVDVETFASDTGYAFNYETDGTAGECVLSNAGVTCVGTADDDIADVEIPPMEPTRPNAVFVGQEGVDYVVFEQSPGAEGTLEAGQRVTLSGTTCTAVDDNTLECTNDDVGFTISGSDQMIETSTEPLGTYFVE